MNKDYDFDQIELYDKQILVLRSDLHDQVDQHMHSKAHILVVLDGMASLDVERSQYVIPNGYFVWIPQRIMHRASFNGKKVSLLNIYFPNDIKRDSLFDHLGVYPIPPILYHIIDMLKETTIVIGKDDWRFELLNTTVHILHHIIGNTFMTLRLPTSDNPVIRRIQDKIREDYSRHVTLCSVSRTLGMSERTINRYMNRELGMSFTQYLRTYRIMIAIRKMTESNDNLSNIAFEVGYDSLVAFSNTFTKVTGVRPSQFFNEHKR